MVFWNAGSPWGGRPRALGVGAEVGAPHDEIAGGSYSTMIVPFMPAWNSQKYS